MERKKSREKSPSHRGSRNESAASNRRSQKGKSSRSSKTAVESAWNSIIIADQCESDDKKIDADPTDHGAVDSADEKNAEENWNDWDDDGWDWGDDYPEEAKNEEVQAADCKLEEDNIVNDDADLINNSTMPPKNKKFFQKDDDSDATTNTTNGVLKYLRTQMQEGDEMGKSGWPL